MRHLFIIAAKAFGKFKDSFLSELHAEITSHINQEESGKVLQSVAGIVVHDSEVLEPDPVRAGGLMRRDVVSTASTVCIKRSINWILRTFTSLETYFQGTC